jgi:hypothetical protein
VGFRAVEVHYFRVPRDLWELYLLRAGQFGVDVISTYIPWMWHEPEEGRFDLAGETDERRDLAGFVELVRAYGFKFLAKPGPFVDAELLGGGVPPWLARNHPELIARRFDGSPFLHSDSHDPRCSVRHPLYVEAVGRWFDAVVPVLLPLQDDGGLVAVQVDNECPGDGFWSYEMEPPSPNRLDYNDPLLPEDLPRAWPDPPPDSLEELAPFVELERLADEQMTGAVATFARMLRDRGITAPTFHDMCCGYWEVGPLIADMGLLAEATGWLGSNVYAEEVRDPFYVEGWYRYSFEEYVHFCHWRPRLMRSLAPERPVFTPEISATGDLYLHAPMMGGTEALCVYMLHQVPADPPELGSYPSWAMEAPMRADGTLTHKFWNGKTLFTWLAACGEALDRSALPADVALVYDREPERAASWAEVPGAGWPEGDPFGEQVRAMNAGRRSQEQAQELVRRQIEFDVVDVRFPPSEDWRARYRHLLASGDPVPDDPSLRYAWSDADGVDVTVRFGEGEVFVTLLNRTQERREGTASWRGGGSLPFAMDGPAFCAAHVRDGQVVSAILAGDARVGSWAFSGRLGAACTFGDTIMLTAPVQGVFTVPVRGRSVQRLTANGLLQDWSRALGDEVSYEATAGAPETSRVAYRTVDGWGETDCLFVGEPLPAYLELFRTYERLMAARVGSESWEEIQWRFAQARSNGDLERAAAFERELRLLRLAALTSPDLED